MQKRILIYGMGVIGSVYALRLAKAGFAVTGVARGERLAALRAEGLAIRNVFLGESETARIEVIEEVPPEPAFDAVFVTVRSGQIMDALGRLRGIPAAQAVFVVGNNLEDLATEAAAAGRERLVLGFGAFGGYREGNTICYLDGRTRERPAAENRSKTTLGIIDDAARPALKFIRQILADAGLPAAENPDMRAWFLYHAALVFPLAGAMYAAGGDQERFCRTRDAIILGIRACKECFRALRALGHRMQPKSLKSLTLMPERFLTRMLSKNMRGEPARVAMFGHANAPGGRNEIGGQAAVFDRLLRKSESPLTHWTRLLPFFDAQSNEDLLPDGERKIRLRIW